MVSSTLGKRTRSSREAAEPEQFLEVPSKRSRRSFLKSNLGNEKENIPTIISVDDEDQENTTSDSTTIGERTPSKNRFRSASSTSTHNTPASTAPVTPSTPRHYDVFANGATTPRHRVMSVGKLFRRMTPQTPLTPAAQQTVYHQARQLFSRSADPRQLIGRDEERAQLEEFLARCSTAHPSGCLYVSGPPGTGKSAMVNKVTQDVVSISTSIRKAYINCMSIKSSKDLYITLLDQLGGDAGMSESDVVAALQKLFLPKRKSGDVFLVVLDEIDHILTLDPESLYRVFEWSLLKTSRLALVGIANALDLTDRFLPRLKSRNLKPELLPFLPYTAAQVKRILTTRLKTLIPTGSSTPDFIPFFHPAAIELCSRKVSTQTGDLRRAFEICRRAIDLVESETRMKAENEVKEQMLQMSPTKRRVLGENGNLATPSRSQSNPSTALLKALQGLTVENAPRVTISHLNKVTAAAFSNGTSQRLKTLNLQQKAALCALMAIEKRNRAQQASAIQAEPKTPSKSQSQTTAPTVKTLYEAYSQLCTRESVLHPLSSSEFREVVGSLETLSLITPVDGKTGSLVVAQTPGSVRRRRRMDGFTTMGSGDEKRVASCVGEKEMEQAVEESGAGVGILRSILSGEALDY
ncbi:cell division control protein 18 [Diplogelasinospora grovesii]|uniref:Cell division control protein n=1 Tax=Diplogelasinospora grovesii TaxID=303347 RepID=A0AAN6S7S7_9PEZI|nr:cell division control protein 18 [Diplogelasinospora grovesii]